MRTTVRGARLVTAWLDEPVAHVREMRSLFLLKLAFRARRGIPLTPLLEAQRAALDPVAGSLETRAASGDGFDQVLGLWRFEAVAGALRFIDALLEREGGHAPPLVSE
jgi:hypothetical protein